MRLVNIIAVTATIASTLLVAGCGGGGGDSAPTVVATEDAKGPINATTGPALLSQMLGQSIVSSGPVPAFGTTAPTTLTFGGTASAPTFRITSTAGEVREGVLRYGSCYFEVTAANPAVAPWIVGNTIQVPCEFTVASNGTQAGSTTTGALFLTFGGTQLNAPPVTYSITPSGQIQVNGVTIDNVTVTQVTGGGS